MFKAGIYISPNIFLKLYTKHHAKKIGDKKV